MSNVCRTRLALTLRGNRLEPSFWTRYFSVEPHVSARKGEPGKFKLIAKNPISPSGIWSFGTQEICQSNRVEDHVSALTSALRLPRSDFVEIVKEMDCVAELWIYVENLDGTNQQCDKMNIGILKGMTDAETIWDVFE